MKEYCKDVNGAVKNICRLLLIPEYFSDYKYQNIEILKYINAYKKYSCDYIYAHIMYNKLYNQTIICLLYDAYLTNNQEYKNFIRELMLAGLIHAATFDDRSYNRSLNNGLSMLENLGKNDDTNNLVLDDMLMHAYYNSFNYQWFKTCIDNSVVKEILCGMAQKSIEDTDTGFSKYTDLFRDILFIGYFCAPTLTHDENIKSWVKHLYMYEYSKNAIIELLDSIINMYKPLTEYGHNLMRMYFNDNVFDKDINNIRDNFTNIIENINTDYREAVIIDTSYL